MPISTSFNLRLMPVRKGRYTKITFSIVIDVCAHTHTCTQTSGNKVLGMIQGKEGTAVLDGNLHSVNLQVFDSGKFPWQRKISGRFKDPIEIHPANRHSPPRPLKPRQWMNTGLQNWTSADSLGTALHIPAASPVSRRACGTLKGLGRGKRKVFLRALWTLRWATS